MMKLLKSKDKGYYEEILIIRNKISELTNEIFKMKQDAIYSYKKKRKNLMDSKVAIKNDLIFSSLFGNNIVL
jgi:hypothetical protein